MSSYEESSSYSSSTVQVAGQPKVHEARSEYTNSEGEAHVKHVRAVGDKKKVEEWHKEPGKPAIDTQKLENAEPEEFEKEWAAKTEGESAALEDKK